MALPASSQCLINLINAADTVWAAGDRCVLWSTDSPGVPEREDLSDCPAGTQGALSRHFCVHHPAPFSRSGSHESTVSLKKGE